MAATRIGIIGDFDAGNRTHIATNLSLEDAAEVLGGEFEAVWLATDESHEFAGFDGLFCSPGSPYRSLEGALVGIRFARENDVPFLGTCGGLQHLVLEYARNVLEIRDAAHAETEPDGLRLFVIPLHCSLRGMTMDVNLLPGSRAAAAYHAERTTEQYSCSFGLNPEYREALEEAGLRVTGMDEDGEARVMEVASHPFCIGTLFVPQARSAPGNPHPLVMEFCRAAMGG